MSRGTHVFCKLRPVRSGKEADELTWPLLPAGECAAQVLAGHVNVVVDAEHGLQQTTDSVDRARGSNNPGLQPGPLASVRSCSMGANRLLKLVLGILWYITGLCTLNSVGSDDWSGTGAASLQMTLQRTRGGQMTATKEMGHPGAALGGNFLTRSLPASCTAQSDASTHLMDSIWLQCS